MFLWRFGSFKDFWRFFPLRAKPLWYWWWYITCDSCNMYTISLTMTLLCEVLRISYCIETYNKHSRQCLDTFKDCMSVQHIYVPYSSVIFLYTPGIKIYTLSFFTDMRQSKTRTVYTHSSKFLMTLYYTWIIKRMR